MSRQGMLIHYALSLKSCCQLLPYHIRFRGKLSNQSRPNIARRFDEHGCLWLLIAVVFTVSNSIPLYPQDFSLFKDYGFPKSKTQQMRATPGPSLPE